MSKSRGIGSGIALLLTLLIGLYLLWDRGPREILPAGPNQFVSRTIVEPLEDDAAPFGDPISISASKGIYARVRLEPHAEPPATFHGRVVCPTHRWPLTLAIYRIEDSPDEAVEFMCRVPGTFVEWPPRDGKDRPPPYPPMLGHKSGWRGSIGYSGEPDLPRNAPGEHNYWTFLIIPDQVNPQGEFVYEIRLYPTADWVSDIRYETGEPVVLHRGRLIPEGQTGPKDAAT